MASVPISRTIAGRSSTAASPLLDQFRPGSAKFRAIAGLSSQAACQSRRPLTGGAGNNEKYRGFKEAGAFAAPRVLANRATGGRARRLVRRRQSVNKLSKRPSSALQNKAADQARIRRQIQWRVPIKAPLPAN
jgi:hypothetical protein